MENKTKITNEMRIALRADFPEEAYSQHPTKKFLTTLKAMYVTERLNDVFGIGRWTIETEIIERPVNYILLQGEFKSLDYEVIVPKQFGGHETSGTNTEIADGFKSALTDCQSKIASYFEIGIDMFKGKIKGNGQTAPKNKPETIKPKTLTQPEVEKKWNGKLYKGNIVYIDNVKYSISPEQATKLKAHKKYIKD